MLSRKKNKEPFNIMTLRPAQRMKWEMGKEETVVVLVPKFRSKFAERWVLPRLRSTHIRVKLDTMGSFVWRQCDGRTTVAEITDRVKNRFTDSQESIEDRVVSFVLKLYKSDLVALYNSEPEQ
jgi:hypothetical protein